MPTAERFLKGAGWFAFGVGVAAGVAAVLRTQQSRSARRALAGISEATPSDDPYLTESITVNRPLEQVYETWRSLESVSFMREAEITAAREHDMCAWRSRDGLSGTATFQRAPGARGTEIYVRLDRPAKAVAQSVTRLLGMAPDQLVRDDLRKFKQLVETGEVVLSDGPSLWRPAQPPASKDDLLAFTEGAR